jgi:predicted Rossmann fold nucleotide-binding protein DprA/Smf involved in DNA uptake
MLVLRNSNAVPSTRGPFDPFPESFFDDIYLWASQGKFDKILIDVDSTKQYDEDMKVLDAMTPDVPMLCEEIAAKGFELSSVMVSLTMLEVAGAVEAGAGGYYLKRAADFGGEPEYITEDDAGL